MHAYAEGVIRLCKGRDLCDVSCSAAIGAQEENRAFALTRLILHVFLRTFSILTRHKVNVGRW